MSLENREKKRISNAKKNISVATIVMVLSSVFMYLERIVFVANMPIEYLGLYSLFTNIFNYLSIADLGINSALMFCLYEPIHNQDKSLIRSILKIIRAIYISIGLIILIGGLILSFFMQFFVQPEDMVEGIRLFFILFIISQASSYFCGYKSVLIDAHQETYITTSAVHIGNCIQLILQMVVVILTKNYLIYILILLMVNVGKYIVLNCIANQKYPYIREKGTENKLPKEIYKKIKLNAAPLFLHKLGKTVINSTDTILLSAFFGAALLGRYNNYILLSNAFMTVFWMLSKAITPGIGDMCVDGSYDDMHSSYNQFFFGNFLFSAISGVVFTVIAQPFVTLSFSSDNLLSLSIVFALGFNLFINSLRIVNATFRDALGLYSPDWYKPILEAIVNIIASIALAKIMGPVGIIIGTTITYVGVSIWIESYVVIKVGFHKSLLKHYGKLILYIITYMIMVIAAYKITSLIVINNSLLKLAVNALIAVAVVLFTLALFAIKNMSARNTFKQLSNIIFKKV